MGRVNSNGKNYDMRIAKIFQKMALWSSFNIGNFRSWRPHPGTTFHLLLFYLHAKELKCPTKISLFLFFIYNPHDEFRIPQ